MREAVERLRRAFVDWCVRDYPPLHGALRFSVYGLLLVRAFINKASPLTGITNYAATDPRLFESYGLLRWLQVPYLDPGIMRVLIACTAVAWACAAIGFLARISMIATAAGVFFLQGMFFASNALNHNWFLTMFALLALCFARTNDAWSVDHYLFRRAGRGTRSASLLDTGFARKLVLIAAAGFYFTAGLSKLATSGIDWADGHVIQYFAQSRAGLPVATLLANNLWLCSLLAVGSLFLEVGAPIALFSRRARHFFLLGWVMMHVGIRLAIRPSYWENVVVLLLLVDWAMAWRVARSCGDLLLRRGDPGIRGVIRAAHPTPVSAAAIGRRDTLVAATVASLFVCAASIPALGQVSWWPLTTVYMYSAYFSSSRDIRAGHPRDAYDRVEPAQAIARRFTSDRPNPEVTEYLSFRGCIRLAGSGREPRYVFDSLGVASWKQLVLTVTGPVLIADLAAKPPGRIEVDPERPGPAQRFLSRYVEVFKERHPPEVWSDYDRLELAYVLASGAGATAGDRVPDAFWRLYKPEIEARADATAIAIASVPLR
jgi:hypothetical protein